MVVLPARKIKGFTLIELMLASSLLMLVLFSGYYAYSLYNNKWQKRTELFWNATQEALAFDSLNRTISSIVPYIVVSDLGAPSVYFQTDNHRMIFVSDSPLFSVNRAVVEIAIEQESDGYILVYREAPLDQQLLLKQSDIIEWQQQVILFKHLRSIEFSYFGWAGYQEVLENLQREELAKEGEVVSIIPPKWYSQHTLERRRILPIKVNIKFENTNGEATDIEFLLPENAHSNLIQYLRVDA